MAAVTDIFRAYHALRILHQHIARLPFNQGFLVGSEIVQPHHMTDRTISFRRHLQGGGRGRCHGEACKSREYGYVGY
jgi:hypothetical protein